MLFKNDSGKKYIRFYIYCACFLITEIIVQSTGGLNSILYPLLYLLILVYMASSPLKNALFFLSMAILTEFLILLDLNEPSKYAFNFNTHFFFYLVFFVVFYFTLMQEKKEKDRYRLLLKTYEGLDDADPISAAAKESKNLDVTELSEQGRKKYDISVVNKLNDKIYDILKKLKDIVHPHTVMYLEIDEFSEKFFIREVISESDHIRFTLEVSLDGGYLGWVYKNKNTLQINNLDTFVPDTFYYTKDEMIKSLIMVPAMKGDKLKGVLLADSREVQYFSNKEENLMYLISYQIMQELDTFKIMKKIEYNAKESAILNKVGKRLNVSLDLEDTINVTLETINNIVKSDLVLAAFITEDESIGKIRAVIGEKYESLKGKSFSVSAGITDFVISKKKKVLFRDFASVAAKRNVFDKNIKLKELRTVFMLPLISNDISFGVLLIASRRPLELSSYTVNTIETLVNQCAISISNAKMYLKMEMMATTDGLTGLYNHKCFQDRIAEEMERLSRYPENICVLLMDIDHFKNINDTYGHPIGDKVLKSVASEFADSLRKVDFAARYGGEEFVAILVNTDEVGGKKMGDRIRSRIENKKINIGDKEISITVSVGIATFPEDSKDKKGLINLADAALYHAKETGRNRCVHHQDIKSE
ncbi:diguanylate cyclase [Thermodesulfobacteriota bacterium]